LGWILVRTKSFCQSSTDDAAPLFLAYSFRTPRKTFRPQHPHKCCESLTPTLSHPPQLPPMANAQEFNGSFGFSADAQRRQAAKCVVSSTARRPLRTAVCPCGCRTPALPLVLFVAMRRDDCADGGGGGGCDGRAYRYDTDLEKVVREWIEDKTGMSIGEDFAGGLKSGVILCTLVRTHRAARSHPPAGVSPFSCRWDGTSRHFGQRAWPTTTPSRWPTTTTTSAACATPLAVLSRVIAIPAACMRFLSKSNKPNPA
jgi:hypothetical protein